MSFRELVKSKFHNAFATCGQISDEVIIHNKTVKSKVWIDKVNNVHREYDNIIVIILGKGSDFTNAWYNVAVKYNLIEENYNKGENK